MKPTFCPTRGVMAIYILALTLMVIFAFSSAQARGLNRVQDPAKPQGPQISDGERKALEKINTSSGAEARLKAAGEFVKKFPKSPMRSRVATFISEEIYAVKDNSQKISLSQNYSSIFNDPAEADLIRPALIEAYLNSNKFDEAISESNKHLEKHPDDVIVLTQMGWNGAIQVQKKAASPKLQQTALQSATKAIELMEADKKPEKMTAENWTAYRTSWLPKLFQAQGVIYYASNDKKAAKENLEKAVGFDPYDMSTLLMLSDITNEEYQEIAKRYQTEKKADLLTQALAKLDEVIDWLARGVAATEGNPQMQPTNQQLMENLKAYYSFRHEGKMEGMNELIKKYKKPQQ